MILYIRVIYSFGYLRGCLVEYRISRRRIKSFPNYRLVAYIYEDLCVLSSRRGDKLKEINEAERTARIRRSCEQRSLEIWKFFSLFSYLRDFVGTYPKQRSKSFRIYSPGRFYHVRFYI